MEKNQIQSEVYTDDQQAKINFLLTLNKWESILFIFQGIFSLLSFFLLATILEVVDPAMIESAIGEIEDIDSIMGEDVANAVRGFGVVQSLAFIILGVLHALAFFAVSKLNKGKTKAFKEMLYILLGLAAGSPLVFAGIWHSL